MAARVECFFDVGSPASYLAWTQLPALCAEAGAELQWRPMLLGGVFQATGNASPAAVPAKGRYMNADLARFAARYGVPFVLNPFFPINTLLLMRAIIGTQMREPERAPALLAAVFEAMWVQGRNLGEPAEIGRMLGAAGFSPEAMLALTADGQVKAALKAATDEAVQRSVFGAPTMFVGGDMFFGQDRLDFVRQALAAPEAR